MTGVSNSKPLRVTLGTIFRWAQIEDKFAPWVTVLEKGYLITNDFISMFGFQ